MKQLIFVMVLGVIVATGCGGDEPNNNGSDMSLTDTGGSDVGTDAGDTVDMPDMDSADTTPDEGADPVMAFDESITDLKNCADNCAARGMVCGERDQTFGGVHSGVASYGAEESLTFLKCDDVPEPVDDTFGDALPLSKLTCFCKDA